MLGRRTNDRPSRRASSASRGAPWWALAALAVYRLSQLIAYDEGPGDLLQSFRIWAGCYDRGEDGRPKTSLGRLAGG